jgi:hypothetical protein
MDTETFDVDALNFPELTTEPTGNDTQVVEQAEQPAEAPKESVPELVTKTEEKSVETPTEPVKQEIKISDPPSQFDGESDLQYNIRKQIYDAGQAKAQAETPEEKSALAQHIKGLRKSLAITNKSSDAVPAPEKIEASQSQEAQTEEEAAKEALRKMGYLSKDEVAQMVQETLASQTKQTEHLTAAQEFYAAHKDIAANQAQRDVLEKFVVERFNITPQSSKQDLLVAMDMARTYLFPKTDNRAQRAAQSADKRDLVSISSNTQSAPIVSKTDEKLAASMKDAGLDLKEFGW